MLPASPTRTVVTVAGGHDLKVGLAEVGPAGESDGWARHLLVTAQGTAIGPGARSATG